MYQQTKTSFKDSQSQSAVSKPRLAHYRALLSYEEPSINDIREAFQEWRDYPEYLVLMAQDREGNHRFKAIKCAKRGNDVYNWRIKKRFKEFESTKEITFFDPRSNIKKTRGLFVTLTFPQTRLDVAWEGNGSRWNRWKAFIRKRFGRVEVMRVWEAHKSGYPHIHALLFFQDSEFQVFSHHGTWRIQEKERFEWREGFVDVEALRSLREGLKYVTKYLQKLHDAGIDSDAVVDGVEYRGLGDLPARASDLTLALMWIFRKRAYAISRGLLDLIAVLRNSNQKRVLGQVDLSGDPVWTWILVGFYGGDLGSWSRELSLKEFREIKNSKTWSDHQ